MSVDSKKSRTILFCIDGKKHTEKAFEWYLDNLMSEDRDNLVMVYVSNPLNTPKRLNIKFSEIPLDQIDSSKPDLFKAKEICTFYEEKAKENGIKHVTVVHLSQTPGSEIIFTAKEKLADLILMGSRGNNAIKRTLLGSVSDYVMHNSKMPVVIIPPTAT